MPILDLEDLDEVPAEVVHRTGPDTETGRCTGGWFQLDPGRHSLRILDAAANVLDELPVPKAAGRAGPGRRRLAVDRATGSIGSATRTHASIFDRGGREVRIEHPAWKGLVDGDVAFDPTDAGQGRMWLVAPSQQARGITRQPPSGVVSLIDAGTGAVLHALDLEDDSPEGYRMIPAPGLGVILAGAYGQDGAMTWYLRTDGTRIERRALGWTGAACDVDAERGEVLFLPHDTGDVEVRTWWEDVEVARTVESEIFGSWEEQEAAGLDDEPDGFLFAGGFLDPTRIVATTWSEQLLVLDRATGAPLGRLVVEDADVVSPEVAQLAPGVLLFFGAGPTTVVRVDRP